MFSTHAQQTLSLLSFLPSQQVFYNVLFSLSLSLLHTKSLLHIFSLFSSHKTTHTMPEAPRGYNLVEQNKKILDFIEDVTSNADQVQQKVLSEILSRNANVEYLKRYDLNGHTDRDTFKKLLPVISYEDIQPDIDRISNGDTSPILCSKPISEFLTRFVFIHTNNSSGSIYLTKLVIKS